MGHIKVVRCTNAERLAYGGIEEGRFFYCTDTEIMWMGTASGDSQVGSVPGTYTFWDPDALPDTPSTQDDHFDDASLDGKWTEWDLGGAPKLTVSEAGHHAILTHATEAAGRFRGIYQTLPAGDFTIATKASLISPATDAVAALCLFEDATNINADILMIQFFMRSSGNKYRDIAAQRWSDYQTFNTGYAGINVYPDTTNYLRFRRNGTNLYYEYSSDGVSWHRFYTHVQPFAPGHMGIATQNNNGGIDIYGYFDFFRYIASDQIGPLGKVRTVNTS